MVGFQPGHSHWESSQETRSLIAAVAEGCRKPGIVEFVIQRLIAAFFILLIVECDHVDDSLWVFLLLLLCDAVCFECFLPFPGKALR